MTKPSQTLGGRLPLADPTTLTGAQRDLFEALKATWEPLSNKAGVQMTTADGRLIGPYNTFLLHPEVAAKFSEFQAAEATYTRFYGSRLLNPERYGADFSKIINEILQPLAGLDGTRIEVRVEVTALNPTGFDESKRRAVSENAETLRFEQHGFEEL